MCAHGCLCVCVWGGGGDDARVRTTVYACVLMCWVARACVNVMIFVNALGAINNLLLL